MYGPLIQFISEQKRKGNPTLPWSSWRKALESPALGGGRRRRGEGDGGLPGGRGRRRMLGLVGPAVAVLGGIRRRTREAEWRLQARTLGRAERKGIGTGGGR
jgi:hypothetical protein